MPFPRLPLSVETILKEEDQVFDLFRIEGGRGARLGSEVARVADFEGVLAAGIPQKSSAEVHSREPARFRQGRKAAEDGAIESEFDRPRRGAFRQTEGKQGPLHDEAVPPHASARSGPLPPLPGESRMGISIPAPPVCESTEALQSNPSTTEVGASEPIRGIVSPGRLAPTFCQPAMR